MRGNRGALYDPSDIQVLEPELRAANLSLMVLFFRFVEWTELLSSQT